ncbi:MAG TPA: hypothetical protein ENN69_09335 [Spirochaetia bacterium]|nr:hypothetical protein [Spirochaetia bacterium]
MISDYAKLGVSETADLSAIKKAFRKKMKELHPDLAEGEESVERHILFVEVRRAYQRLCAEKSDAGGGAASPVGRASMPGRAFAARSDSGGEVGAQPAVHADPAYVFYKNGMRFFMRIHPSQWNLETGRRLNTTIAGHEQDQDKIRRKVMDLVGLFPKAYYYFSIVVNEYPDSPWARDAGDKMNVIEERTLRYKKIIESFSSWNKDPKEEAREFQEKYGAGKPGQAVVDKIRAQWEKQ